MVIIRGLSNAVNWLSGPISGAWQTVEPYLYVVYLAMLLVIGLWIWHQNGRGARVLSAAVFVFLTGEAFRLIPHIIWAIAPRTEQPDALGTARLVSYLTTAGFFLLLELYRQQRVGRAATEKGRRLENTVFVLFGVAVAVCFVRFNEWMSGDSPWFWLILRNLILTAMGLLTIVLWAKAAREDREFRRLPLAVGLVFIFYLPAVLLEKVVPGMSVLMIPRTLAVIWLIWILRGSAVVRGTGYSFRTYIKRYWTLYLLMLLPIAFFAIFRYFPMSYISLAFKVDNTLVHPWTLDLAGNGGMQWFIQAFSDKSFHSALANTILLNLLDLIIGMPMPIIMALLLNELAFPKYKRLTQTVLYLPHFLSWVIISTIALQLFADNNGWVNRLLGTTIPFLSQENPWRAMYIFLGIWKECGWNTIIYLAALTGINAELYEAAEVDGAGRWKKIWHVTLPGIRPTIIVLLIMNLGRILGSEFDRPFTLMRDMLQSKVQPISLFVYYKGIKGDQHSLSTAVGLFQSVVCVIFLVASNTLSKKFGERGIW